MDALNGMVAFMVFLAVQWQMGNLAVNNSSTAGFEDYLSRRTRYVLNGYKWAWQTITVKIAEYTAQLSKEDVDISVRIALEQWSAVTSLDFLLIESGPANIQLHFLAKGSIIPGQDRRIKEPENPAIAITYSRPSQRQGIFRQSDIYFDDGDIWLVSASVTGRATYIVYNIVLHELGHALGLSHSEHPKTVMHKTAISQEQTVFDSKWSKRTGMNVLADDDINAVQQLYPPLWRQAINRIKSSCEGDNLILNCTNDHLLHIVTTEYGNNENWAFTDKCEIWNKQANCAYPTNAVANRCNKRKNCSIFVSNENLMPVTLGDPCVDLSKTLRVRYVCS